MTIRFKKDAQRIVREKIKNELFLLGWSDEVELDANSKITITSINQDYGLCLQTGNMSRFYADLIKLEYLFKRGKINKALFILPSKCAARTLGSNIANFYRLTQELNFFKNVITLPIQVIGIR